MSEKSDGETIDSILQTETCPVCSEKLDEGFAICSFGLGWQPEKSLLLKKFETLLPRAINPKKAYHEAKRCTKCKFVLLPY